VGRKPGYDPITQMRARTLRQAPTRAEAAVWALLRGSRLGARFRRQQPVGPYIADFYCAGARLIVELDGPQHGDDPSIDAARDHWLATRGYRVLRLPNAMALGDQDRLLRTLGGALRAAGISPLSNGGRRTT